MTEVVNRGEKELRCQKGKGYIRVGGEEIQYVKGEGKVFG